MVIRATLTARDDDAVAFLVDSTRQFPLFLQDGTWKRAGVDVQSLTPVAGAAPNIRQGSVPTFRLGGFDMARLPAVSGIDIGEITQWLDIDLGGVLGADLLAFFRITVADEGRFMWIEPDPMLTTGSTSTAPAPTPAPHNDSAAASDAGAPAAPRAPRSP
jgi:hypothetical protein